MRNPQPTLARAAADLALTAEDRFGHVTGEAEAAVRREALAVAARVIARAAAQVVVADA